MINNRRIVHSEQSDIKVGLLKLYRVHRTNAVLASPFMPVYGITPTSTSIVDKTAATGENGADTRIRQKGHVGLMAITEGLYDGPCF